VGCFIKGSFFETGLNVEKSGVFVKGLGVKKVSKKDGFLKKNVSK